MARHTRTAPESTEEAPAPTPAAPVRRTRRRRVVDHAAQAELIIASLLESRGGAGASQAEVQQVVLWARGVMAKPQNWRRYPSVLGYARPSCSLSAWRPAI